jgi:hypothetical protein
MRPRKIPLVLGNVDAFALPFSDQRWRRHGYARQVICTLCSSSVHLFLVVAGAIRISLVRVRRSARFSRRVAASHILGNRFGGGIDPEAFAPSSIGFGKMLVRLYAISEVERLHQHLEAKSIAAASGAPRRPGRRRLWTDAERRDRRARYCAAAYRSRRGRELTDAGQPVAAAVASQAAATIRDDLRAEYDRAQPRGTPRSRSGWAASLEFGAAMTTSTAPVAGVGNRPPVSAGRQPVEVEVFDPADDAHRLRVDGVAWSDIALATGYSSPAVCPMAVTAYLQKAAVRRTPEQQHAALQVELDRLDALQRGCWQAATTGEVKSAQLALKIIVERAKLLGLDQIPEDAQPRTIVIGGSEQEYIAGLKRVIAGTESTPP